MAGKGFDIEEFLVKKLQEIPGPDILILTLGGILGFNGYTPLTALINTFTGGTRGAFDVLKRGTEATGGLSWIAGPIGTLVAGLLVPGEAVSPPMAEVRKGQLLNAMTGAIESYAITRPGVAVGLAQAVGEILPL
jgi:hypothetical protein